VSAGYCLRVPADESGVIITQIGEKNTRSEIVSVLGTPCAISPRNSYSNWSCVFSECSDECVGHVLTDTVSDASNLAIIYVKYRLFTDYSAH
jgi:hypothetical protein